jgi:hypothetical protein
VAPRSSPFSNDRPAARIAQISACAVASRSSATRFRSAAMIFPSRTMTQPIGDRLGSSPRSVATSIASHMNRSSSVCMGSRSVSTQLGRPARGTSEKSVAAKIRGPPTSVQRSRVVRNRFTTSGASLVEPPSRVCLHAISGSNSSAVCSAPIGTVRGSRLKPSIPFQVGGAPSRANFAAKTPLAR